jgi:hypothetical protein
VLALDLHGLTLITCRACPDSSPSLSAEDSAQATALAVPHGTPYYNMALEEDEEYWSGDAGLGVSSNSRVSLVDGGMVDMQVHSIALPSTPQSALRAPGLTDEVPPHVGADSFQRQLRLYTLSTPGSGRAGRGTVRRALSLGTSEGGMGTGRARGGSGGRVQYVITGVPSDRSVLRRRSVGAALGATPVVAPGQQASSRFAPAREVMATRSSVAPVEAMKELEATSTGRRSRGWQNVRQARASTPQLQSQDPE